MKIGVRFSNADWRSEPEAAAEFACAAEECGFDSVWAIDRPLVPWADPQSTYPYSTDGRLPPWFHEIDLPDPMLWLTYVAGCTSRLVLATGVLVLPLRSALLVAKQAATLQQLSCGRFILGVGSGWLPQDFDAVGVPFSERYERLEDSVSAMRTLWTESSASYEGTFMRMAAVDSRPRPASPIPIHLGGSTSAAARRAGRLGDGFCPQTGSPQDLALWVAEARHEAEMAGRDPDALEVTIGISDLELLKSYRNSGANRVVLAPPPAGPGGGSRGLRHLATELHRVGVRL